MVAIGFALKLRGGREGGKKKRKWGGIGGKARPALAISLARKDGPEGNERGR